MRQWLYASGERAAGDRAVCSWTSAAACLPSLFYLSEEGVIGINEYLSFCPKSQISVQVYACNTNIYPPWSSTLRPTAVHSSSLILVGNIRICQDSKHVHLVVDNRGHRITR